MLKTLEQNETIQEDDVAKILTNQNHIVTTRDPAPMETDMFEPWSTEYEAAVLDHEDAAVALLSCLKDGNIG